MKKTQNLQVDETQLSEDELYSKIQTEKLLKKKKAKQTATFASLCVAMALAIVVIVLAAVPASFLQNDISIVNMYTSDSTFASFDKQDSRYQTFKKYLNKSFSQPYLSAIFSGSLFSFDVEENGTEITGNNALTTARKYINSGDYLVKLRFNTTENNKLHLVEQNGRDYVSQKFQGRYWNGSGLTFEEVYIQVQQKSGMQDTKIFVIATYPRFVNGQQSGTINRLVTVTVKADTNVLYEAWNEIGEQN